MRHQFLFAATALFASAALAAVPDLTSELEYVANPNQLRWGTAYDRMAVTDLMFYRGKLFVGGGATELNAGPVNLQQIDPVTKKVTIEGSAGTENISVFKVFSDGRLYVPSQDPRDYDDITADDGHVFVRNPDGDWTFYNNVPRGNKKERDGSILANHVHNWDMEEFDGRIFVAGYGINASTDGCASWTPAETWTTGTIMYTVPANEWNKTTGTWNTNIQPSPFAFSAYRRELQFMRFDDRLFVVPDQLLSPGIPQANYNQKIELHKYNPSTKLFEAVTNTLMRMFPGMSADDLKMVRPKAPQVNFTYGAVYKLWHTTPFANRVFYVVSPYETQTNCFGTVRGGYRESQYPYPMFGCAADPTPDGLFTSERLDFGTDEFPFDFLPKKDAVYALTVHYNPADKQVRHTVWRAADGHRFERVLTFNFHQYCISMEYENGYFYFGAGYKQASQAVYELDSQKDAAGGVYRVRLPMEPVSVEASASELSVPEGGTGSLRFRLSADPGRTVTLPVRVSAGAATTDVQELTFSSADWSTFREVAVSCPRYLAASALDSFVTCGEETEGVTPAWVQVKPIVAREAAPSGLIDLTSPTGVWSCSKSGSAIVVCEPFNDSPDNTDTSNRLCIKATRFDIDYDFRAGTVVDAYAIRNFGANTPTTRPPSEWTFLGSTDGANWVPLTAQTRQTGWTKGEFRYFSFPNTTAYRHYRLSITANNGDTYTQFAHLEYYHVTPEIDPARDRPAIGPEGGATSLVGADGNFNVSVANARPGLYYTAFTAARLTDPFMASATSVKMTAGKASGFSFRLPADGNPSLFVRIVASDMPYQAGTPLPGRASKR